MTSGDVLRQIAASTQPTETDVAVGPVPVEILPADVRRFSFIISNTLKGEIYVSTRQSLVSQQGICIPILGRLEITAKDFGPLAQMAWYCGAFTVAGNITVFQVPIIRG